MFSERFALNAQNNILETILIIKKLKYLKTFFLG